MLESVGTSAKWFAQMARSAKISELESAAKLAWQEGRNKEAPGRAASSAYFDN